MFSSLLRHSATTSSSGALRPSPLFLNRSTAARPPARLSLLASPSSSSPRRAVVIPPYPLPSSTSSTSTSTVTLQTLPTALTAPTDADGHLTKLPWAKNRIEESLALSCLHPHRNVRDAFIRHLRTARVVLPANADTLRKAKQLGQFVFMVFKTGDVFQFPVFTSKQRWREFANPQWTSSVTMDVEHVMGDLARHFKSGGAELGKGAGAGAGAHGKRMDVRLVVNPTSFYSDSVGLEELTKVLPLASAAATHGAPKRLKAKSSSSTSSSRRKSKKKNNEMVKKMDDAFAVEVAPKTDGEPVDV